MKKVINITIGHTVFSVEDDAYEMLDAYLKSIKKKLKKDDDVDEIIDDIEIGIAEKFVARGRSEKNAISPVDVEAVMKEMGSAEDIDTEDVVEKAAETVRTKTASRRLYRNPDDVILAGVASGIATYFGIDPLIVRILFLVLVFTGGAGVWVYIVLWILVPEAKTPSQKLEMRGEQVTLANIRDYMDDTIENIKKKDKTGLKKLISFPVELLRTLTRGLTKLFRALLPVVRVVFGILIIVICALIVVALVVLAIGVGPNVMLFNFDPATQQLVDGIFSSPMHGAWFAVSTLLSLLVPVFVCITIGESIVRRKNMFTFRGVLILFVMWVASVSFALSVVVKQALTLSDTSVHIQQTLIEEPGFQIEIRN